MQDCACRALASGQIKWCPLHAAAGEMREALADLLGLGRAGYIRGEDIAVTRAVENARALLAKVKGE